MKKYGLLLIGNLLFFASLFSQNRDFVTLWKFEDGDKSAIEIRVESVGEVQYYWSYEVGFDDDPDYMEFGSGMLPANSSISDVQIIEIHPRLPKNKVLRLELVSENLKRFSIAPTSQANKDGLIDVWSWGDVQWTSMEKAFSGARNLNITATDKPNLRLVEHMSGMFSDCRKLTGPTNINNWELGSVKTMDSMFYNATLFNQPLNNWRVDDVVSMSYMFCLARDFNQPLNDWKVVNVRNMRNMFNGARSFNQPLNNWDVSNVRDMAYMFSGAQSFDQPIDNWDVSNVRNMRSMFSSARSFNQPLNNWDVSNVRDMVSMFNTAQSFNQPLNDWNVSNVEDMSFMFTSAESFNQPLDNWNVSNVTNMTYMFYYAPAFNKPIGNWDVSNVQDMSAMFAGARSFNQPLNDWNVSNVTNMQMMFEGAYAFNQPLDKWDVSNVDYFGDGFAGMFYYATSFDQNLGSWKMHPNTGYITLSPSGMSCENYTLTLIGWAANNPHLTNVFVDVYHTSYGPAADAAIAQLKAQGWSFDSEKRDASCIVTLPVVFGDVRAVYNNKQLLIDWTTLSEVNNAYFEIEISTDGKSFNSIGRVQSLAKDGNSDGLLHYSFNKAASRAALLSSIVMAVLAIGSFVVRRKKMCFVILASCTLLGISTSCHKQENVSLPAKFKDLYIRIKQVDKDGGYQYSKTVKVLSDY